MPTAVTQLGHADRSDAALPETRAFYPDGYPPLRVTLNQSFMYHYPRIGYDIFEYSCRIRGRRSLSSYVR